VNATDAGVTEAPDDDDAIAAAIREAVAANEGAPDDTGGE
jgi:hypothetical protein